MRAKIIVCALVVLAGIVYADCQPELNWPVTAAGTEAELECTGETVGYQVRKCLAGNIWDEVDTSYCLPMYPAEGKGYVDVDLYLSQGNTETIKRDEGAAIKSGLLAYYTMLEMDAVTIHRVHSVDTYTAIQVRITTEDTKADSIYKELQQEKGDEHVLTSLDEYITRNKKSYYKNTGSQSKADFFVHEVNKREPKAKNNMVTVIVIVVVIIALIVGVIAGFFIWLQIKRNGPRNGSKQLKSTSKV